MKKNSEEDWLEKCLECQHIYRKKDDAETVYCRCRNGKCNFKQKVIRKQPAKHT